MAIRSRRRTERDLHPGVWAILNDELTHSPGEVPDDLIGGYVEWWFLWSAEKQREVWMEYRVEVLESWGRRNPGTRPLLWWRFDAPEARRRVGGKGDRWSEKRLGRPATYVKGIPTDWITAEEVQLYNGRPPFDGPRSHWSKEWVEGHFPHTAWDPSDPPIFESEADYLDRLGLLTDRERQSLGRNAA